MTSRKRVWIAGGALLGVVTLLGCADSETVAPAGEAVVPPVTPVAEREPEASSASIDAPTGEPANDESPAAVAEEVASPPAPADSAAAYEPPFPDRVDLFVAPKRQGNAGNQESSDRAVELMGFVRVDRPRAILSINGETSALAQGESVDGIEVISVQPPSVVLSRGRQRWQATIE